MQPPQSPYPWALRAAATIPITALRTSSALRTGAGKGNRTSCVRLRIHGAGVKSLAIERCHGRFGRLNARQMKHHRHGGIGVIDIHVFEDAWSMSRERILRT